MVVNFSTNARINLLGNPSDIFHGIVISSTIKDLEVKAKIKESEFNDFTINGDHNEGFAKLILNSIDLIGQKGFKINPITFSLRSNIPKQAGLAGSSAIIINFLNCINRLFNFNLDKSIIAHYATIIEHEIIGIIAGPSDRFIISYGGALYMDFTSKDYKKYILEDQDLSSIPLWIGIRSKNIDSGDIHKFPFYEYPNNPQLQQIVINLIECAIKGKEAIINGDLKLLGTLMNRNQELTSLYGTYGNPTKNVVLQRKIDNEILDLCIDNNVLGVKLAGSSGSIVVLSEDKPEFLFSYKSKLLNKDSDSIHNKPQIDNLIEFKVGNRQTY